MIFKFLVVTSLTFFSASAFAREFYSLPFEVRLTYSQMGESKLNMGSADGLLVSSDDGAFSRLEVDGHEFQFDRVDLRALGRNKRPRLELEISVLELLRIADLLNTSIWRSARSRNQVEERIQDYRAQAYRKGDRRMLQASYDDRETLSDLDLTWSTVQIHDRVAADSILLEFDFDTVCTID